jgi:hypothetical protein
MYTPLFGYVNPEEIRFGAVPKWSEKNPVLSEADCEDHDDLAEFAPPIRAQKNNNCTNASLSDLAVAAFKAAGVPNVPQFSWGFNYALCNGGQDQGAMCRDVIASGMQGGKGMMPVALWSDSNIFLNRGELTDTILAEAAKWQFAEVYQCMDWADVRSALARRFFVYHGFVLGGNYSATGRDGKVPKWDGRRANGHAMWSRGLTRRFGDLRTITPNTWGTGFGDAGVGYWDQSYFWSASGNYVNLDCYAVRAVVRNDELPIAE